MKGHIFPLKAAFCDDCQNFMYWAKSVPKGRNPLLLAALIFPNCKIPTLSKQESNGPLSVTFTLRICRTLLQKSEYGPPACSRKHHVRGSFLPKGFVCNAKSFILFIVQNATQNENQVYNIGWKI